MIDNEMMRNGSGYKDETAYKAMTMSPKPGEIWERKVTKDHMLIVAKNGNAYSCLRLCDLDGENKIKVISREAKYTNPVMLEYAFPHIFGVFVKTLPDAQFQEVRRAVADVFGFQKDTHTGLAEDQKEALVESLETKHVKTLEAKMTELNHHLDELTDKNLQHAEETKLLVERCNMLEKLKNKAESEAALEIAKRNMYKELYDSLLDKFIASRGGAGDE